MSWGTGIMEYWNTGFGGFRSSYFHAHVPFFHHSIIPQVNKRQTPPLWWISKRSPQDQDTLLRRDIADEIWD
jgi:hypothetical protein